MAKHCHAPFRTPVCENTRRKCIQSFAFILNNRAKPPKPTNKFNIITALFAKATSSAGGTRLSGARLLLRAAPHAAAAGVSSSEEDSGDSEDEEEAEEGEEEGLEAGTAAAAAAG